jgi:multidrug efflux system outer membrane protein
MRYKLVVLCMTAGLTGCMVGPNYKRPDVPTPPQFRRRDAAVAASLGDTKWFDLFQDAILRDLIKEAMQANYDVRIAAQLISAG